MVFCYVGQTPNAKMFLNCELGCYGVALSSLFWCMLCACDWLNLHVCMSVCGCVCIHVNIIYNTNKLECQWFQLCKHHDKFSAFYETEFWYQTLDNNVLVLMKHDARFSYHHSWHMLIGTAMLGSSWLMLHRHFQLQWSLIWYLAIWRSNGFPLFWRLSLSISSGTDDWDSDIIWNRNPYWQRWIPKTSFCLLPVKASQVWIHNNFNADYNSLHLTQFYFLSLNGQTEELTGDLISSRMILAFQDDSTSCSLLCSQELLLNFNHVLINHFYVQHLRIYLEQSYIKRLFVCL